MNHTEKNGQCDNGNGASGLRAKQIGMVQNEWESMLVRRAGLVVRMANCTWIRRS
jgi:hypothetical protein